MEEILTDQDIQFFKFDAILLSLSQSEMKDCDFRIPNPVKVYDDENKMIGSATVFLDGGLLRASVSLLYDCPARLDITNDEPLYLVPHGVVTYHPYTTDDCKLELFSQNGYMPKLSVLEVKYLKVTWELSHIDQLIWT